MAEASNGRQSLQTIADALADGRNQLWHSEGAFALTSINDWPTGISTFEFIGLVGEDRKKWLGVLDDMLDWARGEGCSMVETTARPGWRRVLKDWDCTHVFLEKKI
jgi:hypothetical protein